TPGTARRGCAADLRVYLDLAAQMQQECPVRDLAYGYPVEFFQRVDHLLGVCRIGGVAGQVDGHMYRIGVDDVQRRDDGAGLAYCCREAPDRRGVRGHRHPYRDRETG